MISPIWKERIDKELRENSDLCGLLAYLVKEGANSQVENSHHKLCKSLLSEAATIYLKVT